MHTYIRDTEQRVFYDATVRRQHQPADNDPYMYIYIYKDIPPTKSGFRLSSLTHTHTHTIESTTFPCHRGAEPKARLPSSQRPCRKLGRISFSLDPVVCYLRLAAAMPTTPTLTPASYTSRVHAPD